MLTVWAAADLWAVSSLERTAGRALFQGVDHFSRLSVSVSRSVRHSTSGASGGW
jgi:hypothetical protein